MSPAVVFVGGSKGGVGKSMISMALLDYLKYEKKEKVLLIETETSNPDVYKAYRDLVDSKLVDLSSLDGWIDLANIIEGMPEHSLVINSAARLSIEVESYGKILNDAIEILGRRFLTLWVINRQRDSLELLKNYMEMMPKSELHVIMNLYWGSVEKFSTYASSISKKKVEENGGKSLTFPELADRVADELNVKRLSICRGISEMPIGNRIELSRWRSKCASMFEELSL